MIDATDIRDLLRDIADRRPRNHQTAIGPSELGGACDRRLGYRMLGTAKNNTDADPLASWIGTAVHAAIEQALADDPDWLCEIPVTLPGYGITGTLDAYHAPTRTVLDWKVVGATTLRKTRLVGMSEQYRTQVHTYGLALDMAGTPVAEVAVAMIPRSGRMQDLHLWSEPLNPAVVEAALRRYEQIQTVVTIAGDKAPLALATGETFCQTCPWYLPGATDPAEACPGHIDPPTVTGPVTDPTLHDPTRKDTA